MTHAAGCWHGAAAAASVTAAVAGASARLDRLAAESWPHRGRIVALTAQPVLRELENKMQELFEDWGRVKAVRLDRVISMLFT